MIINNPYVQGHPLWKECPSSLQDISNRDYPNMFYFNSLPRIDSLDLDTYEKSQCKHSAECTGDAVIGIAFEKVGEKLVEQYLLLVELRMGYKNGDNLDLQEIKKKVEHSKVLLNANGTSRIFQDYFFIFTDAEAPQANNKINRKANEIGRMTNYKVLSVSRFKNCLLDPAKIPYKPKHSKIEILNSFLKAYTSSNDLDIGMFSRVYKYWYEVLERCKLNYDMPEAEHIISILKEELRKAKNVIGDTSSDSYLVLEIMEEEVV